MKDTRLAVADHGITYKFGLSCEGTKRGRLSQLVNRQAQTRHSIRRSKNCNFETWIRKVGRKGPGKPEHTLCTPLSFIETRELQIHLRHSEKLPQVEVLKNPAAENHEDSLGIFNHKVSDYASPF